MISIHAPHARSDYLRYLKWGYGNDFNPRSSCEERPSPYTPYRRWTYFNPRSSCEERLYLHSYLHTCRRISIHAPHARSDLDTLTAINARGVFQSTLLMRGATSVSSKHAATRYFNPRSSCEERHRLITQRQSSTHFNPRSSCEERLDPKEAHELSLISIHAPHARSDVELFQTVIGLDISIHAPHARSDARAEFDYLTIVISIHAPHARSDADCFTSVKSQSNFNPRSSCEERLQRCGA